MTGCTIRGCLQPYTSIRTYGIVQKSTNENQGPTLDKSGVYNRQIASPVSSIEANTTPHRSLNTPDILNIQTIMFRCFKLVQPQNKVCRS